MNDLRIAAQLYSFKDFIKTPAGLRETLTRLKAQGYAGVQLNGALVANLPGDELLACLDESGMQAPTCHYDAKAIVNDSEAVIDRLKSIHCHHVAYPYPHWMPTGEGEAIAYAQELNRAAQVFKASGIELAYHNHDLEFARFGGRTFLEIIYDEADALQGELDTYWVQCGGGDPVRWIQRLSGRQRVLHIKDYGMMWLDNRWQPAMMPIGSGNLPWADVFAAADDAGVEWHVVEHDAFVVDPFASFESSIRYLRSQFGKGER